MLLRSQCGKSQGMSIQGEDHGARSSILFLPM